jgi:hypothetical protein
MIKGGKYIRLRLIIICLVIVSLSILGFALKSDDLKYEPVEMEKLDKDIQSTIKQIREPNIYIIQKDSTIILFSNLGLSGFYTNPSAVIKKKDNKLIVNIRSNGSPSGKDLLLLRIYTKSLPKEIEATFDGKIINNYKMINLE